VGYIQTFVQAHQARQCDQKAQTVEVKAVGGWVGGGGGDIQTSELRARQLTAVEVRTGTPLMMQLGRPMLKWSSGAAGEGCKNQTRAHLCVGCL
jgi:hypothetical protein